MNNKRITLQKIAGIGAVATVVPSSWVKPIISSVVLPAHAQTSFSGDLCMGNLTVREIDGLARRVIMGQDTDILFIVSRGFSTGSYTLGFSVPPGFSVSSNEHTYIDPNPDPMRGPEESETFLVEVFEGATLFCTATVRVFWENN